MSTVDRAQLRELLQLLAQLDAETAQSRASEFEFSLRDCRLELARVAPCEFSDEQLHRLKQLESQLQMTVTGHGLAEGIAPEARRVLNSFGWTLQA